MDNKDIDNYTNEKNIEESQITLDKQADKNIEKTITIKSIKDVEPKYKKPKRTKWEKFRLVMAFVVCFCVLIEFMVFAGGIAVCIDMIKDAPVLNIDDFVGNESTKMYDRNGEIITEVGAYLRENITYEDMPEALIDAVLAIEDSRYFEHFGFDIPRFIKSGVEVVKARSFVQGGSTLTMQLVKNTYYQTDNIEGGTMAEKKIERKVQEIYLAMQLDKSFDKKTIFELYLNKLNFGGNIRGVQKAAYYYFGKSASTLNTSECALLAGVINGPNGYNPYYHLEEATDRRNTVLDMMAYHGYITLEDCELAKSIKIEDQLVGEDYSTVQSGSQYQSYIDVVIQEAQEITGKDPSFYGMTIYTNMDRNIQQQIERIQNSEDIRFPDDLMQVSMITIENDTGSIVGVGGGRNYEGARLLNRAISQYKQPGSSVKPLLSYALAFEYLGWSLDHIVTDRPITYPFESRVLVNSDGKYRGDVPLKDAVGTSLNIPAILTLEEVVDTIGKEKVVDYMQSLGFTRVTDDNFHLSFAIGGTWFETTPYEMAGAQAAMLNGGIYNKPHTIEKIIMQDGSVYYPSDQNRKVISSGSAWMVTELLYNNVYGPYFNYMQILKRDYPVYAKTGTSDWGSDGLQYGIPKGAAKDRWMIASTAEYTNALWVGYDKGISGMNTYFSSYNSSLNIPGNINKLILDACETSSNMAKLENGITKPNDVDEITYVYGTYPYAKPENWMTSDQIVTSYVSKAGEKDLVSIYDYEFDGEFNGISASQNEDGGINISWSVGNGGCFGNEKDISLIDDYNNIPAYGTCLFDYSWILGESNITYWATIYSDGNQVGSVSTNIPSYSGWPGELYGNVKVCGGYTSNEYTSETKCTAFDYSYGYWDDSWGPRPW